MASIKEIFSDVQGRLETAVPELAYIDKDRGQLTLEKPAVEYPCALLDVRNIDYTQEGHGVQMADMQLIVTVADLRPTEVLPQTQQEEEAFRIIDLLERIHAALHLFSEGGYAPLFRTNLKKVETASPHESYEMTYQTAFEIGHDTGETAKRMTGVRLEIDRK